MGFLGGSGGKNQHAKQESQMHSLDQEDPLEEEWQPTPGLLPGEPHGQRSLAGYIQSMGLQRVGCD